MSAAPCDSAPRATRAENGGRSLAELLDLLTSVRVLPSAPRPEGHPLAPLDLRAATARRWHSFRRGRRTRGG